MSEALDIDYSTLPSLPPGWTWAVPAEICSVVASGSTPTADKMAEGSGDVPFIKVYNLTHRGHLDFSVKPTFIGTATHQGLLARSRARPGDVLINIVGPPLGKVSVVPDDFPEWNINQAIVLFRPYNGVYNKYLAYAFLTESIMKRVTKLAKATAGQFNIGVSMCRRLLPVPLAPPDEQLRIVSALDEMLSDLDAGVSALERAQASLKKYRAAVLKAAVTGELTAEWRKKHPNVEPASKLLDRILTERRRTWEQEQEAKFASAGRVPPSDWRAKYPEPAVPDTTGLPMLPANWCWASLEQLNRAERPMSYGVLQPGPDLEEGVPLVRVCDVADGKVDETQLKRISPAISANYQRTILEGGEVLLTIVGTIGRTAVVSASLKGANTARAVAVIPLVELLRARYVEVTLRESGMRKRLTEAAHEVARKTLNLEDVRKACVPLAPLHEQDVVISEVERLLSVITATEDYLRASLKRAERLRQSILKEAFSGRLVPQDPKDEPASVLLERIAQSRSAGGVTSPPRSRAPRSKTLFEDADGES